MSMVHKSSTHRQRKEPLSVSVAVPDGKRERANVRVNNPALVTKQAKYGNSKQQKPKTPEKKLLFFGQDFLVLNIGIPRKGYGRSLKMLDAIFSFPHNDTNAAEISDFAWPDSDESVSIHFAFSKDKDELAIIFYGKEKIMSVQKITDESMLRMRLGYKYNYRISFYGVFFALSRIGKLKIESFWKVFLVDIENGSVAHSLSRLDICADITNINPIEISRGVKGDTTRMKKFSTVKGEIRKPNPETIMYGSKGDNRWFARIYKKLIEMAAKGKERFYLDYLKHSTVTRLELIFKSPVLHDQYHLTLNQCLDTERIFTIFSDHLKTKYVRWDILPFIKREMKKKGYGRMVLPRYKKYHNPLPRSKKFHRIRNAVKKYVEAYDYDLKLFCEHIYLSIDEKDD